MVYGAVQSESLLRQPMTNTATLPESQEIPDATKLPLLSHQEQFLTVKPPMRTWFARARAMERADPRVLQALPPELRNAACLCPRCAQVDAQLQAAAPAVE